MADLSMRADLKTMEHRLSALANATRMPARIAWEVADIRNRLAFERERLEAVRHLLEKATTERRERRLDGIVKALDIL